MKQNAATHYMAAKDCPFSFKGQNLAELRRARLRLIAKAINVPGYNDLPKHELVVRIIGKLRALGAEADLGNI